MTKRKTILSGKRQVIDGKHILTTPEILTGLTEVEKKTKKRKISRRLGEPKRVKEGQVRLWRTPVMGLNLVRMSRWLY